MAQRESGYERLERDAYNTPAWPTEIVAQALKHRLPPGSVVWEPAAGRGQMVAALASAGLNVIASDIQPDVAGGVYANPSDVMVGDFLGSVQPFLPFAFDAIFSNPPYKGGLAERFVRRALELTKPHGGVVAMLLGAKFDFGKTRRDIFDDHPAWGMRIALLDRIWWFEPRLDDQGRVNGPSEDHAWYVWDWSGSLAGRPMRYATAPAEVLADVRSKTRALKAEWKARQATAGKVAA